MKIAWRQTLNQWKNNTRNSRSSCVPKDQFPGLLNEMLQKMSANSAQNLKSGFQKCGLFPHNRDKVLQRLPNQQIEENVAVRELLSESFLENLRATRMQVTTTRPYRRRRRVNVPAGRGITGADLEMETINHASRSVHSDSEHSELELDITTTPASREFVEPEHSDSDQSVSILLRNAEAASLVSDIEKITQTVPSSSCQPNATTTESTNNPPSAPAVVSNTEPQPGTSTTFRQSESQINASTTSKRLKKCHSSSSTPSLIRKPIKSRSNKNKFHEDSDDSTSDSHMSSGK